MELFNVIEEGVAHIRSKGLYRQVKVYRRGKDVFAGYGGGYIKLGPRGGATRPDISWDGVDAPGVTLERVGGQPKFGTEDLKAA